MIKYKKIILIFLILIAITSSIGAVSAHDPFAPEIKFLSPKNNSDVQGQVKVKVSIETHSQITDDGVDFLITGSNNYKKVLKDTNPSDGWECIWDTSSVPNGKYSIMASAYDVDFADPGTNNVIVNLNNIKKETKLDIKNVKGASGEHINIMATLKESTAKGILAKGIVNKKIQFTINGKTYTGITDNGGISKIKYKGNEGNYNVYVKFLGDNEYSISSSNANLTLLKNANKLKIGNIVANKNKEIQLKTNLIGANNKGIANRNIKFYIDNFFVGSSKTDKAGMAKLIHKLKLDGGKYTITAVYGNNVINSATLKVLQSSIYLKITSNKAYPKAGNKITIYYRIKNNGPNNATNTKLAYKIPKGLSYLKSTGTGSKKYDSKLNTLTWTLKKAKVGTTLLKVQFKTKKSGRILLSPKITTETYNPNLSIPKTYITVIK
ncbi:Ig-like domain-containing protein [Methanobrevibacter filiformis]|uniref:DUF11 domain-containing protein n=1 Tax=Methanobrevibacter filiformis TaxID=55758 RepID=A0A166EWQ8_9EURY|nr:Ig-like domain-containing protein [Methanobrevibacter filiformis]KZX17094.1 hypothetical protein MBFIL_03440 [Methanobrevibacter filiformis]